VRRICVVHGQHRGNPMKTLSIGVAAATFLAWGASAGEQTMVPSAFEHESRVALVVFQDLPGSTAILRGNYSEGLDRAQAALERSPRMHVVELEANICAARVMLRQLEAANSSCEAALEAQPPVVAAFSRQQYRAVAHVNHGVAHLLQGDSEFAFKEFSRARSLFPSLGVASSNRLMAENMMRTPQVTIGEAP
jgi:tetratricopeptide (TPR) repeat protein